METSKLQEQYYADMDDKDGSDLKLYLMGREQILPGVSCDRVLRQHYLLHFIMRGRGIFRQGGRHYPVEAGQAFLITPDTFCSYVADEEDPYAYAWVEFDGLSAKDYLDRAGISRSSPIYTGIDISCMEYLMKMIDNHANSLRTQAYFLLVLDRMIINCPPCSRPLEISSESAGELYIRRATKYITLNYWKNPSVQEVADFCGIDRSHLSRLFKQKTNQCPQAYIVRYRINTACTLLKTTDLTLAQIASAIGYADQFCFSKAFKKEKGIPPLVWREQYT